MSNPVGWFEVYVQDMGRAKAFYEATLGLKLSKLESPGVDMMGFPMEREGTGASVRWSRWPASPRAPTAS